MYQKNDEALQRAASTVPYGNKNPKLEGHIISGKNFQMTISYSNWILPLQRVFSRPPLCVFFTSLQPGRLPQIPCPR